MCSKAMARPTTSISSSQDAGVVGELLVREGDAVEAGARVFRLDPERLAYGAQSAEAQRAAATAAVRTAQARSDVGAAQLRARRAAGRPRLLPARAPRRRPRRARRRQCAARASAPRKRRRPARRPAWREERLNDLAGAAPAAGTIEQIFHRPGEVVAAGQPIAALLPPENMKVRFFAPEAMLAQLPVGARVHGATAMAARKPIAARVSFVAREPQFTPPVIYSLDQREKLVFLVEARFDGADADPARHAGGCADRANERRARHRCARADQDASATAPSSIISICKCRAARSTASWVRTARARRRRSAWCAAC